MVKEIGNSGDSGYIPKMATDGLYAAGRLGYRAVRKVLKTAGIIARTEKVADKALSEGDFAWLPSAEKEAESASASQPVAKEKAASVPERRMINVPADGNCLFHSFIEAVKLKLPNGHAFEKSHLELREEVVDYLRQNKDDPDVSSKMLGAFLDEQSDKVEALQDEIAGLEDADFPEAAEMQERAINELAELESIEFDPETYLANMQEEGTFGNDPEIYALSKLYPVRINVFSGEGDQSVTYSHSDTAELPELTVRLRDRHYMVEVSD
jgi:hypothetical protein